MYKRQLIGCDNSVFYNVYTKSYNSNSVSKKTDKAWNNIQYCNNLVFQGTTWDSLNACKDKMKAAMSGITVTDKNVKAEDYKPETTNPDTPSGGDETTGETWTVSVDKCSDFFNDAVTAGKVKTEPKLEVKTTPHNIGYIYDNEYNAGGTSYPGYEQGFAFPDCDVAGLEKLIVPIARQTDNGTQKVSVRLDSKTGTEIASATLTKAKADGYVGIEMPVTLPEGVDTSKTHKIFLVFTSTGSTAKYVANVRDLTGVKSSTALARESVDISNGMTAGTEYNTNGAYGTVKSLEDATVHVLAELDPAEAPVTIGGAEYKQFVQASTAANSEGAIPGNGTATYVFSPKVDCSVTLHSRATSKVWYFLESPDGANVTNTATDSAVADVMTFNLRAGRTYYYYCQGSKPMVYGIYFDAPVADADSLLKEGTRKDDPSAPAQSAEAKSVKLSWTAVENDTDVFYGVDTYVDGVKVDMVDGITDTNLSLIHI